MKVSIKLLIILLLVSLCILPSCKSGCKKNEPDPYDNPYGKRIEEDLTTTNIIEDNYRNYYEIFVRSFNDSNMDLIGDLNGVTNKLDYIKDLGYNGIWLMPINPSSSYHKYDVNDYYNVDKSYGTIDDLKKEIEKINI